MIPDVLQFQCSACKTVLTVPAQMAGVTGPCPVCGQTITSPSAPPSQPSAPPSLFASQAPRPSSPPPVSPLPVSSSSAPPPHSMVNPVMPMPHSIAQHLSPMGMATPPPGSAGRAPAPPPSMGGAGFLGGSALTTPEPSPAASSPQPGLGQTLLGGLPSMPPAHGPAVATSGNSGLLPPRRPEGVPPLMSSPQQTATPWGGGAPAAPSGFPSSGFGSPASAPGASAFPGQHGSPLFPHAEDLPSQGPAGMGPSGQGSPLLTPRNGGAPSHSSLIPGSPTLPTLGAHGGTSLPQNSLLARDVPSIAPSPTASPDGLKLPEAQSEQSPAQAAFTPRPIKRPKRSSNIFMFALAILFLGGFIAAAGWMFREPIMQVVNRYLPSKSKELEIKLPTPNPSPTPKVATSSEPTVQTVPAPSPPSPKTPEPSGQDSKVADTAPAPKSAFDPNQPKPPRAEPASPEELAALQGGSGATPAPPTLTPPSKADPLAGTPPKPLSSALQNNPDSSGMTADVNPATPATRELKIEVTEEAKPAADALMHFLTAKDLQERLKYTLAADMMKPLMERYYQAQPSGPVRVDAVGLVRFDPKPQIGGGAHAVFGVESRGWEYPVPVMLEETPKGFQVDWLSFVEFKDRLLEKFFEGYQEGTARFHVGITRTHYFEDKVPNTDNKDAFRIGPAPPNPYLTTVFVEKDSQLGRDLRDRIPWGAQVWAIVDLEWVKLGTQQWVQLASVPQLNWYSVPAEKKPKSGKTSELPNEIQRAVPVGR